MDIVKSLFLRAAYSISLLFTTLLVYTVWLRGQTDCELLYYLFIVFVVASFRIYIRNILYCAFLCDEYVVQFCIFISFLQTMSQ